jgi:hypothetical protein
MSHNNKRSRFIYEITLSETLGVSFKRDDILGCRYSVTEGYDLLQIDAGPL